MRRIAKTDSNQQSIIDALRQIGAFVYPCHAVGCGFPDLFVAYHSTFILLECKTEKGKLSPEQVAFHKQCHGPIFTVKSPKEAVHRVINATKGNLQTNASNG